MPLNDEVQRDRRGRVSERVGRQLVFHHRAPHDRLLLSHTVYQPTVRSLMATDETVHQRSGPGPDTYETRDRRDGHYLPQDDWDRVVAEAEKLYPQEGVDGAS